MSDEEAYTWLKELVDTFGMVEDRQAFKEFVERIKRKADALDILLERANRDGTQSGRATIRVLTLRRQNSSIQDNAHDVELIQSLEDIEALKEKR